MVARVAAISRLDQPSGPTSAFLLLDHRYFVMNLFNQGAILAMQFRIEAELHRAAVRGDPGVALFKISSVEQHVAFRRIESRRVDRIVDCVVAVDLATVGL